MKLHPSIIHINAKKLSESTIKMINKMVEKVNEMENDSTELKTLKDINSETIEGRYLMAAIAKITTESQTDKTPDEVLEQLAELQKFMYKDSPPVNNLTAENARLREALEDAKNNKLKVLKEIQDKCLELTYPLSHGIKNKGAAGIIDKYIKALTNSTNS